MFPSLPGWFAIEPWDGALADPGVGGIGDGAIGPAEAVAAPNQMLTAATAVTAGAKKNSRAYVVLITTSIDLSVLSCRYSVVPGRVTTRSPSPR
ncbi:hypothetical protein MABM_23310 [Mycobacteroides abscessus]|nr:hypothetical protein MABM_23310 [Mycobacteroides abscessus]